MANETSVMAVIRASRPSFRNSHDKIAFAVHASFLAAGYVLTATGSRAFSEEASSAPSSSSGQEEVGIDGWNEYEDCYGFVYSKAEKGSNKKVLVKCLTFDDKLAIDVLRCGGDQEPLHLEVNVKDHVSSEVTGSTNYGDVYKKFDVLIDRLNSSVLSKLEDKNNINPSSRSSATGSSDGTGVSQTHTRVPVSRESGIIYPPVIPGGSSDLYPGPGAGFFPPRGDLGVGGSMLVGPDDPRWFGMGGGHPDFMPGVPGVPPGARFDPYGPPNVPGFEPGRFVRNPPRRPGGDVHPDLPHFRNPHDFV
ncbi:probable proteasome inhibitor [Aristolochia californica]|uniref:probable proteasome inhibitor n=1 Tax=Aristolochia californica TaxID=171875 RepID=UPI0035E08E3D